MESSNNSVKAPVKRLPGQLASQVLAKQNHNTFQPCSQEKPCDGKSACTVHKYKNCSKVPKIVRVQSKPSVMRSARPGGKFEESGDNRSGPSKITSFSARKNIAPDKLKPSHIPRRKSNFKEICNKEHCEKKNGDSIGGSRNCRNVQRVQLLINQDFRPEDRMPASVASTRPIPTLGQIYERSVMDPDRLDANWFLELDAPANSLASDFFNISSRLLNVHANAENVVTPANKYITTAVTNMEFDGTSVKQRANRTTDETLSEWLSTDQEYPTRDNESGYRSQSPPTHIPVDVKSKNSKCSFTSGRDDDVVKTENKLSKTSMKKNAQGDSTATVGTLNEQQTVVLSQLTHPTQQRDNGHHTERNDKSKADQSKNYQYPSRDCAPPPQPSQAQVTVPSYVECPSEILQKTTNFEDMIPVTCDSPNTISSSIGGAETDFHDDLSSQYTLEQGEFCLHEHCTMEWCQQCRSCARDEKSNMSEDTSVADSLICHYNDSLISSDDQYVHQCRWRSHYEAVKHCKKCQQYRRFPSTRYKLPKTLSMLRKRMSMRICRRRLSRVWKKTTERWAMWSAKSPHKFRKLRMMHYLQRHILWEDADVQTNVFIYREIGTEPTLKELKSAGISAIVKYENNIANSKPPPEKKSCSQEKLQEKLNSIGKENNIDNLEAKEASPETLKIENHVITQTASNFYSKDKFSPKSKYDVSGIPEYKSESCIEICEVNMDDKQTGTEDMLSPMHDNVTCTELDLNIAQLNNIWEAQNTRAQIVCNNAETDVKFPSMKEHHAENVLTSMSDDKVLYTPCGTNTDMKNIRSINLMTSRELLKRSPTFSHIETQITPVQSSRKISTGIKTSKRLFERNSEKIDTSTEIAFPCEILKNSKDFANQIMPHIPSFQCTVTKTTSTSTIAVNEAYSVTSQKDLRHTGFTCESRVKSGVCLTSPSLQQCCCPVAEFFSRGTETDDIYNDYISQNKLKTYFNTGMLINNLVEGALVQTDQKSSSKDRYPKRLSVETNSSLKYANRSASSGRKSSVLSQKRNDHSTQFSHAFQKDASPSCFSTRIGQSRLICGRNFSYLADEASAQTEPIRIDSGSLFILYWNTTDGTVLRISQKVITRKNHRSPLKGFATYTFHYVLVFNTGMHVPQQYKCTSVFTSQCCLDQPVIPAAYVPNDFDQPKTIATSSNQKKSSSSRNSSLRMNTSAAISSDLDADKWIKSCIEKGYQRQLEVGPSSDENKRSSVSESFSYKPNDYKKSDSKSAGSEPHFDNEIANVNTVVSAINDMALEKYDESPTRDAKQIVKMVDDVTSDEVLRKQVKEITLQASPESCEAATASQVTDKQSISLFTSRCILPHLTPCKRQMENSRLFTDCLFVYGKPRCVMHPSEEINDAAVQIKYSTQAYPTELAECKLSTQLPPDLSPRRRSLGMVTSCCEALSCQCHTKKHTNIETPVAEKNSKSVSKESSTSEVLQNLTTYNTRGIDVETEANLHNACVRSASMLTSPDVRSAAVITSLSAFPSRSSIHQQDQYTQRNCCYECDNTHSKLLEIPTHDDSDPCVKSHLATSCRYYSGLLTRHLDKVRENLTKHLTPNNMKYQTAYQLPSIYTEACTMKPSACEEFGCQTFKNKPYYNGSNYTNALTPAISVTNIGQHDKEHLKSVYNMLMAIEGRLRRIKANME